MNSVFNCSSGNLDIRDYTLIDALGKISQEQNTDLQFAIWESKPQCEYVIFNRKADPPWEFFKSLEEAEKKLTELHPELRNKGEELKKQILHIYGESNFTLNILPGSYTIFNQEKKVKDEEDPWESFPSSEEAKKRLIELDVSLAGKEDEQEKRIFRQYNQVEIISSSSLPPYVGIPLSPFAVLIPLNFRFLEKQSALSLTLEDGVITLKDDQNRPVGSLSLEDKAVKFTAGTKEQKFEGELAISQAGELILKPKNPKPPRLFLGQGFRFYEMDLNDWSPVEEQAPLHLCAANAAVSLIEHFERVADGRHLNASRLFLHQVACHLSNLPPTAGPSVRSVVEALATFGVPLESSWPYDPNKLQEEPPEWCYGQARSYRATSYLRLDRPGIDKNALIAQIKIFAYSGMPAIFGFSIHEGAEQAGQMPTSGQLWQAIQQVQPQQQFRFNSEVADHLHRIKKALGVQKEEEELFDPDKLFCVPGCIPFPTFGEIYSGGHAAVVVGYDDEKIIVNRQPLTRHDRHKLCFSPAQENEQSSATNWHKLRFLGVKAYLLTEHGQWEEYQWQDGDPKQGKKKGYIKVTSQPLAFEDFQFMKYQNFNGLFVLLIKHQSNQQSNKPLVPRDVLFESTDTMGIEETIVDEYLATKGAFKIRNSWGKAWGDRGYGWLPYAYVYQDLTFDWWSILKFEWMNTDSFGLLRDRNDMAACDIYTPCGPWR
jgi:C1A family cysteine protease